MNIMQLKRGDRNDVAAYTGPQGEIIANVNDMVLSLQDGSTVGGTILGSNLALASATEITYPLNGATGIPILPTILCRPYRGLGLHTATRWQIANAITFNTVIHDSGWVTDTLNLYVSPQLNHLATYYVRVMHRGVHRGVVTESLWSKPQRFMTL